MKSVLFYNVEKRSTATGFTKDLIGAYEVIDVNSRAEH